MTHDKHYLLRVENQIARLYDENGLPLASDAYEILCAYIRRGKTERRAEEALIRAKELEKTNAWVFPDPQKRREIYSSGSCVYFLTAEKMPDLIKIGKTHNLANRTKTIAREFETEVTVVAFVKTHFASEAEDGFHALFSDKRHWHEWFHAPQVLSYIQQFRNS